MYIKKIEFENLKSFKEFSWRLSDTEDPAGWHVLLGDNGSGKSTFIKAVALALMGTDEANKTRQDFANWVRKGCDAARIRLEIFQDEEYDSWTGKGNTKSGDLSYTVKISDVGELSNYGTPSPTRHIWGKGNGWFSASYGPFRRFTGGNRENEKLFYSAPILARHLSVFGEDIALTETLEWLRNLRFKELEDENCREAKLLRNIYSFINQNEFLPNQVKMDSVGSEGVFFVDAAGMRIDIGALSDGYRSVLSMILELIRQMSICYNTSSIFNQSQTIIDFPGVVFIDEVDVHLHLRWQRKIGEWLTKHFPRVQFIVSSHSPFVCQSATHGSIWRLPRPGDEDDEGERIQDTQLERLLYGNILEALSSGAFGYEVNRSDNAAEMLQELAGLNTKAMFEPLSAAEIEKQNALQQIFNTNAQLSEPSIVT